LLFRCSSTCRGCRHFDQIRLKALEEFHSSGQDTFIQGHFIDNEMISRLSDGGDGGDGSLHPVENTPAHRSIAEGLSLWNRFSIIGKPLGT